MATLDILGPYVMKSGSLVGFFTSVLGVPTPPTAINSNPTIYVDRGLGPVAVTLPMVGNTISVSNGGTGYLGVTATISPVGAGSGATCTVQVSNGKVVGFLVTNPGSGYTSGATVSITGHNGGSGATASVTMGTGGAAGTVVGFTIITAGSGYNALAFSGGGFGCVLPNGFFGQPTSGSITNVNFTSIGVGMTAVPTVSVGTPGSGSGATFTMTLGPFWTSTSFRDPLVTYQLPASVLNTDIVTYTIPGGAFSYAGGSSAAVSSQAAVTNYSGQLELALAGDPWKLGPMAPTPTTMLMGTNIGWAPSGAGYQNTSRNWIHAASNPWTPTGTGATSSVDGHPILVGSGGYVLGTIADPSPSGGNGIDAQGVPVMTGIWTLVADESNPGPNAMTVQMYGSSSTVNTGVTIPGFSSRFVIQLLSYTPGPGGIGSVWTWNVQLKNGFTTWDPGIGLAIKTHNGLGGSYTLSNEWLFAPGNGTINPTTDRADPMAPDPNLIAAMTTASGNGPACLRFMEPTSSSSGDSMIVYPADKQATTDYSYSIAPAQNITFTVTDIQFYDLTVHPTVYFDQPAPGTTAAPGGSPAPYQFSPASVNFLQWDFNPANTNLFCGECITSHPHTLRTGDIISLQSGTANCTLANSNTTVVENLAGLLCTVWVTSSTSFAFTNGNGFLQTNGGFGHISIGAHGLSLTGTCVRRGWDVTPYAHCAKTAGAIPGCSPWFNTVTQMRDDAITALAIEVRDSIPPGRKVRVEHVNEPFNITLQFRNIIGVGLAQLGGYAGTQTGYDQWRLLRAQQVWNLWIAAFNLTDIHGNTGRGTEIVRVVGTRPGNPGQTTAIISWCNTNLIAFDELCTSLYVEMTPNQTTGDPSYQMAAASMAAGKSASIAFGSAYPWTRAMFADLVRHDTKYRVDYNGKNGNWALHNNALKNYDTVHLGPIPKFTHYENALDALISPGVSLTDGTLRAALQHDLLYDPEAYNMEIVFQGSLQIAGFVLSVHYNIIHPRQNSIIGQNIAGFNDGTNVSTYGYYLWQGQPAGYGLSNKFWTDDGKCHDGPPGSGNQSPRAQAWLDLIDKSSNVNKLSAVDSPDVASFTASISATPTRVLESLTQKRILEDLTSKRFLEPGLQYSASLTSTNLDDSAAIAAIFTGATSSCTLTSTDSADTAILHGVQPADRLLQDLSSHRLLEDGSTIRSLETGIISVAGANYSIGGFGVPGQVQINSIA